MNKRLEIDMTTPIEVSELSYVRPLTMPINVSKIISSMPRAPGGTSVARQSWFGRVWNSLTSRTV
jgi:hypothetical protein